MNVTQKPFQAPMLRPVSTPEPAPEDNYLDTVDIVVGRGEGGGDWRGRPVDLPGVPNGYVWDTNCWGNLVMRPRNPGIVTGR